MDRAKIIAELLSLARQSEDAAKANDAGAAGHNKEYEALCRASEVDHTRMTELYEYVVGWPRNAKRLRGEAETFRAAVALLSEP